MLGGLIMEEKKNMQNLLRAGDIVQELNEIKSMQESGPYVLTFSTSTCGEYLTIICC